MEYHFIYLIKEKQDIDTNEPIFKIGKSTQENTRRVKSYPSGSHLLLQVACEDCHCVETFLIREFKRLFTLARGREYFRGDVLKMINLIFCIVQKEVNPNVEYIVTDNYNLSLCVNSKGDHINYSFNNKDNILDEYYRELSSEKRKYNHLEIKYNSYKHDTTDSIKELETINSLLQNSVGWEFQETKINELSSLNKSIQITNNELLQSNQEYRQKLLTKDKLSNELQSKYNEVSEILHGQIFVKEGVIDELNKSNQEYKQNLTNKEKMYIELQSKYNDVLQRNTLLINQNNGYTGKLSIKERVIDELQIKYNDLYNRNNFLIKEEEDVLVKNNKLNRELTSMKGQNTGLILDNKKMKEELIWDHKNNIICLDDIKQRSYRPYYCTAAYMMYNMFHQIYTVPSSVTNWTLLGGGCIILMISNKIIKRPLFYTPLN